MSLYDPFTKDTEDEQAKRQMRAALAALVDDARDTPMVDSYHWKAANALLNGDDALPEPTKRVSPDIAPDTRRVISYAAGCVFSSVYSMHSLSAWQFLVLSMVLAVATVVAEQAIIAFGVWRKS